MKSANNKSHISTTGSFLESPVLLCGCALICPADARPVGTAFSTSHLSCFQSAGSSQTKRSPHGPTQYMRLDRVPKTGSGPVSNAGVCLCALVWPCRLAVMNMYAHANSRCPHPPDPVSRGLQRVHVPGRPSQAAAYPPVLSAWSDWETADRRYATTSDRFHRRTHCYHSSDLWCLESCIKANCSWLHLEWHHLFLFSLY